MSFKTRIQRKVGSTSQKVEVWIENSAAAGTGKSGLLFNTSLLTCYYKRNTDTQSRAVTLATITTFGTYATGGFKEVDATNMIGLYEFHIPNAALASGADLVTFVFQGASGMLPVVLEVELTQTDNQDAVRGGMTALPNTPCTGSEGLTTTDNTAGVDDATLNSLMNQLAAKI